MDFLARRDRLRKVLKKAELDALLVTDFTNVTYLTGFTGDDSYLLVRKDGDLILSDPRYTVQFGEECPGLDLSIRPPGVSMLQGLVRAFRSGRIARLAIEADSMTVGFRDQIADRSPKLELIPTGGFVERLRLIKDKDEIARIRTAIWQAEKAFGVLRSTLRPEMTEKDAADELEHQFRLFGAKNAAFASIVAVGPRAALPHATPGANRIGDDDFVLVDWGANEGLYNSDLTRVLITGRISPKLERIYGVVLEAQRRAIAAVRPGALAADVDDVARAYIAKAGFGHRFRHGLGHGLGLQVHEAPRVAVKSQTILQPGMVVTVEPGIYLPGWGGVRIEDDVLVTRTGHEVLTHSPKELAEVVVG
ncbi:MAG: Xaa-Pro peptidase family protein [Planctomycetaceae bacterium]|nr:Xaa-Pro peptidase family protein [Planctomycetaceae bacterium]